MGNCLGGFGEGTPAATAGSGTSFPHGDFTAISFIGLKDQGKRSLVKAIAAAYDVEVISFTLAIFFHSRIFI